MSVKLEGPDLPEEPFDPEPYEHLLAVDPTTNRLKGQSVNFCRSFTELDVIRLMGLTEHHGGFVRYVGGLHLLVVPDNKGVRPQFVEIAGSGADPLSAMSYLPKHGWERSGRGCYDPPKDKSTQLVFESQFLRWLEDEALDEPAQYFPYKPDPVFCIRYRKPSAPAAKLSWGKPTRAPAVEQSEPVIPAGWAPIRRKRDISQMVHGDGDPNGFLRDPEASARAIARRDKLPRLPSLGSALAASTNFLSLDTAATSSTSGGRSFRLDGQNMGHFLASIGCSVWCSEDILTITRTRMAEELGVHAIGDIKRAVILVIDSTRAKNSYKARRDIINHIIKRALCCVAVESRWIAACLAEGGFVSPLALNVQLDPEEVEQASPTKKLKRRDLKKLERQGENEESKHAAQRQSLPAVHEEEEFAGEDAGGNEEVGEDGEDFAEQHHQQDEPDGQAEYEAAGGDGEFDDDELH